MSIDFLVEEIECFAILRSREWFRSLVEGTLRHLLAFQDLANAMHALCMQCGLASHPVNDDTNDKVFPFAIRALSTQPALFARTDTKSDQVLGCVLVVVYSTWWLKKSEKVQQYRLLRLEWLP